MEKRILRRLYLAALGVTCAMSAATPPPACASDTGFHTIRKKILDDSVTTAQKNEWINSIADNKFVWTGWVNDVSNDLFRKGMLYVSIEMDDPRKKSFFRGSPDISFSAPPSLVRNLKVNQKITFSCRIKDINRGFGDQVDFVIKDVDIIKK